MWRKMRLYQGIFLFAMQERKLLFANLAVGEWKFPTSTLMIPLLSSLSSYFPTNRSKMTKRSLPTPRKQQYPTVSTAWSLVHRFANDFDLQHRNQLRSALSSPGLLPARSLRAAWRVYMLVRGHSLSFNAFKRGQRTADGPAAVPRVSVRRLRRWDRETARSNRVLLPLSRNSSRCRRVLCLYCKPVIKTLRIPSN